MKVNDERTQTIPLRPFCLEYNDAKKEVFEVINNAMTEHNIPLFLMENILAEAYRGVKEGAWQEMQSADAVYQKQIAEFERSKGKELPKDDRNS